MSRTAEAILAKVLELEEAVDESVEEVDGLDKDLGNLDEDLGDVRNLLEASLCLNVAALVFCVAVALFLGWCCCRRRRPQPVKVKEEPIQRRRRRPYPPRANPAAHCPSSAIQVADEEEDEEEDEIVDKPRARPSAPSFPLTPSSSLAELEWDEMAVNPLAKQEDSGALDSVLVHQVPSEEEGKDKKKKKKPSSFRPSKR